MTEPIKIVRIDYSTMNSCARCGELMFTQGCFPLFSIEIGRVALKLCSRHLNDLKLRLMWFEGW